MTNCNIKPLPFVDHSPKVEILHHIYNELGRINENEPHFFIFIITNEQVNGKLFIISTYYNLRNLINLKEKVIF